jgi:hypothetical protein
LDKVIAPAVQVPRRTAHDSGQGDGCYLFGSLHHPHLYPEGLREPLDLILVLVLLCKVCDIGRFALGRDR